MAKFPELEARAAELGATPPQVGNLKMLFTMHGKMEPERWADFFPHVVHVHGKFYGIVDGQDPSIDWPVVARVLREQNYTGFISSEYEAHAYSDRYNAFDQIRAQHDMLKRPARSRAGSGPMSADCDVLIVGSGPVGTAIARELADREAGLQIVVLEAGRALGDTAGGHVKNIADTEERDRLLAELATGPGPLPGGTPARPGTVLVGAEAMPNAAMSTNVGGMGAHWTAACPRPVDDEVPDCIDPAVLDEALTRAEQLLAVTTHAFDRAPLTGAVQQVLGELFDRPNRRPVGAMPVAVTVGEDGALHWTGPAIIAGDLWERPDVELRTGTLARRVVVDGDRATGVEVVDVATGERSTITARAVVVAADAWRTPQLLWASGIRPEALGRYLTEHPQIMAASVLDEKYVPGGRTRRRATCPLTASAAPGGGAIVPVSGRLLGALRRRPPVPRAGHADGRLARAAGPGRHRPARSGRRARLVLQEGAVAGQPRLVRRRRHRRARPAGHPDRLRPERCRRGRDRRGEGRDRRGGAGAGPAARRAVRHAAGQLAALPRHHPDGHRGRRHQRLRPHRPRLGHRQPLRRRQQRHPDRHRLQPDRDRGRDRRPHRPHPGRLAGRHPAAQGAPA